MHIKGSPADLPSENPQKPNVRGYRFLITKGLHNQQLFKGDIRFLEVIKHPTLSAIQSLYMYELHPALLH